MLSPEKKEFQAFRELELEQRKPSVPSSWKSPVRKEESFLAPLRTSVYNESQQNPALVQSLGFLVPTPNETER